MPILTSAWLTAARLRRKAKNRLRPAPPREELVRRHAPGRSFADIGCMWSVDGAIAFLAEESGATTVTGMDVMAASERYRAEHERRGSTMRFVQGDLHDPERLAEVGRHDVAWCSGVLYHAPHPIQTLGCLRGITGELLILSTETIPEVPGFENACVFYPGLSDRARAAYDGRDAAHRVGISTPFDAEQGYGNWWWGMTPSALTGMLVATGFEVVETVRTPFHVSVVARPVSATR